MASVAVTQFAAQSFREFAKDTAVDSLFVTYIEVLPVILQLPAHRASWDESGHGLGKRD